MKLVIVFLMVHLEFGRVSTCLWGFITALIFPIKYPSSISNDGLFMKDIVIVQRLKKVRLKRWNNSNI